MEASVVLLSIIINVSIFCALYSKRYRGRDVITCREKQATKSSRKSAWIAIKMQLSQCIPRGKNIIKYSQNRVSKYGADHTTFAAFLCFNYILPYFMWIYGETYRCNVLTITRFLGAMMCIPIIFKNSWPTRALKYFPTYWHMTVMYTLPLSTTLSFLIMGGTREWLLNIALAIIMLSAVVDQLSFIILAVLGIFLGIKLYDLLWVVLGEMIPFRPDLVTMHYLIYTCTFATSIGLIFLKRRKKEKDKRWETLELFGKIIGKEVQNILSLSRAYASSIQLFSKQMYIDALLPTDDNRELLLIKMDKRAYSALWETTDGLVHDSARDVQTLNKKLATLRQCIDSDDFTILSMQKCVTDALNLYGLTEHQKKGILININEDFQFYGSAYYMQQIVLNLLDNTYAHSQQDCTIEMWLSNNRLHVKDNGSGIAREALPYIFDPFFTTSKATIGIGLSFCKLVMDAFGGTIICKSKQGNKAFTELVLAFPQLKKQERKKK
jgi:signal transduction histidine kinase